MAQKELKRRSTPEREPRTGGRRSIAAADGSTDLRDEASAGSGTRTRGSGPDLTTANKIMVAAAQLDERQETFTAEDLIVVAWKQFPESFGLSGYRELYPDSNRVLSKLMGSVGLCSRGWLEQVSTKTYKMTQGGRKLVAGLRTDATESSAEGEPARTPRAARRSEPAPKPDTAASVEPQPSVRTRVRDESAPPPQQRQRPAEPAPPAPAPSRAERELRSTPPVPVRAREEARASAPPVTPPPASKPRAAEPPPPSSAPTARAPVAASPPPQPIAKSGAPGSAFDGLPTLQRLATSAAGQKFSRGGLVTFADACQFWAINPGVPSVHLAPRLQEFETLLKRAEQHIQRTGSPIRVNDRLEVSLTTVIGLQGLHRMLLQKYNRELSNIRGREEQEDDEG